MRHCPPTRTPRSFLSRRDRRMVSGLTRNRSAASSTVSSNLFSIAPSYNESARTARTARIARTAEGGWGEPRGSGSLRRDLQASPRGGEKILARVYGPALSDAPRICLGEGRRLQVSSAPQFLELLAKFGDLLLLGYDQRDQIFPAQCCQIRNTTFCTDSVLHARPFAGGPSARLTPPPAKPLINYKKPFPESSSAGVYRIEAMIWVQPNHKERGVDPKSVDPPRSLRIQCELPEVLRFKLFI